MYVSNTRKSNWEQTYIKVGQGQILKWKFNKKQQFEQNWRRTQAHTVQSNWECGFICSQKKFWPLVEQRRVVEGGGYKCAH